MDVQNKHGGEYPSELDNFIGKQMLFKVEITDGNLLHNWRNYVVKRTSGNADLIKQFISPHKIEISNNEVEENDKLGGDSHDAEPLTEEKVIECGDSTKSGLKDTVEESTPCSKVVGKRVADSVGSATGRRCW